VETEAPGWRFNTVRNAAGDLWNQALSRIRINEVTDSQRRQFFTATYHTMLVPSDRERDLIRSLIDIYRHEG
jgi:putative alpha-1,2-mannosidase